MFIQNIRKTTFSALRKLPLLENLRYKAQKPCFTRFVAGSLNQDKVNRTKPTKEVLKKYTSSFFEKNEIL